MESIKPKTCSGCGYYHYESVSCEEAKKRRTAIEKHINASIVDSASKNS